MSYYVGGGNSNSGYAISPISPPLADIYLESTNAALTTLWYGDRPLVHITGLSPGTIIGQFKLLPTVNKVHVPSGVSVGATTFQIGNEFPSVNFVPYGTTFSVSTDPTFVPGTVFQAGTTATITPHPNNPLVTLNQATVGSIPAYGEMLFSTVVGTNWQKLTSSGSWPTGAFAPEGVNPPILGGTNPTWLSVNSSGYLIFEGGVSADTTDVLHVSCDFYTTSSLPANIIRNQAYTAGQTGLDPVTGTIQMCVTSGTTNPTTAPTFRTQISDATVTDGTVGWVFNLVANGLPKFYTITAVP